MFKKRETVLQNMTYIAIMSAINVIFVLLTTLLPILFVLIIFLLPLTSLIVYCFCKKRYFPIYAVSTIGLCLIFNLWRVTDTIFYVIPSIITGLVFGICIEKKVPVFYTLFITTLIGVALTYASFPLIQLIVNIDTIEYFLKLFNLSEFAYKDYLPPLFIFAISSIQMALTYIVIKEEVVKLGIEVSEEDASCLILFITESVFILGSIGFAFIYGPISLLLFGFAIYVYVYQLVLLFADKKVLFMIAFLSSIVVGVFVYAAFNQSINKPFSYLLMLSVPLIINIVSISNYCLEKNRNKDKLK